MRPYELTKEAETDLEEIVRYTIKEWGREQAENYLGKISNSFEKIAEGKMVSRTFSKNFLSYVWSIASIIIFSIFTRMKRYQSSWQFFMNGWKC